MQARFFPLRSTFTVSQNFQLRLASRLFASRPDRLESILSRWVRRAPGNLAVRLRHAFCAHDTGRYEEALARWEAIRARWPDHAMAWTAAACNLRELSEMHRAREIIDQALQRFPTDLIAISEAIRIYEVIEDVETSLRLSSEMVRLEPQRAEWRANHLQRLLAADRIDQAQAVLDQSVDHGDAHIAIFRAQIALRRKDWPSADRLLHEYLPSDRAEAGRIAALRDVALHLKLHHPEESRVLWEHIKRVAPDAPAFAHHRVDVLIRCGRLREAEVELAAALRVSPDDDDLLIDKARIAARQENYGAAIAELERMLRRRPDLAEARKLLAAARLEQAHAHLETGGENSTDPSAETFAAERQDVGLVEDEAVRRLLLRFESIGQDCEFGLVQRRYGAEPLGLFRWNSTQVKTLREASDAAFEGLGQAENTEMYLWADYEYYVADKRWGFAFHTWLSRHEVDRDQLFAKMCRRVAFLRDKLLSDLAGGDKMFVLKTFAAEIEDVRSLLGSLRAHGPVRLLWVRSLDMPGASRVHATPGIVEEIEPGLYAGYVSRFGNRQRCPWQINFGEWVDLCRAAALVQAAS